ncbi:YkgJ family cysteine cluster protein [Methanomassiliicoccus luminyensis]|uniref:YkgJ family cysteine cluster protein n=1 Tax=Methanomassiliicoccus luminyensis TaxID=1080712 RepID=UPI00035E7566|nr:YkgJ family cysteine cluster protein [Methanomassiliicoccus luminyensis]
MPANDLDVDMSELEKRRFTCDEKCGLCCLCQAELLPHEVDLFKRSYPNRIVMKDRPHRHVALALKKGEGPCDFLLQNRRCSIYKDRPHYCRQFPFHMYLGTRVQVELDLSCRGVWTDQGEDALVAGGQLVAENAEALRRTLQESRAVYREFEANCKEAGIYRPAEALRRDLAPQIPRFADVQYLARVLDLSAEEEEMEIPGDAGPEYPRRELEGSAMETGLESLSAEDVYSAPVYCDPVGRWNIFLAQDGGVEWSVMNDDGGLTPVRTIDPAQVKLLAPEGQGLDVFTSYMRTLNARDSALGYAYYLVDDYGYEDFVANTYNGTMATAALDLLWRASLIAHVRGGKLDRQGMIEGIIAYDMDRLDAPTIGAFL